MPIVAAGFFLIARYAQPLLAELWLIISSLVFYGWWNPRYLGLLLTSIVINFLCASYITLERSEAQRRLALGCGIALNLCCLFYFKYANFFLTALSDMTGSDLRIDAIALPIGISFFTFTQIAFLVDAFRKKALERSPLSYGLFVTFFPHLIAGPVLHHSEMMPQFANPKTYGLRLNNVLTGSIYFLIGMLKKVIFADSVSPFADRVFDGTMPLSFVSSWEGALCYTLQIYFDFSGYSDMAIGLAKIFNIDLPLNFDSPYKSSNMIEFWRRWHMTLSRFLRDYLYFPLGGNKKGAAARFRNLLITMVLGGLWHGANWTFVVWGTIHGIYLVINHAFRSLGTRWKVGSWIESSTYLIAGRLITFVAVVFAWVFFRSDSLQRAWQIIVSMVGGSHLSTKLPRYELPQGIASALGSWSGPWIVGLCVIAWIAPNSQHLMSDLRRSRCFIIISSDRFMSSGLIAFCWLMLIFTVALGAVRGTGSPFIYFNF